jgi:hypothetical protein
MPHNFHELLHQAERVKEYRDSVRGNLFLIHNILTEYFPDLDISSLRETMRIIDTDFKSQIIEILQDTNHSVYRY